MAHVGKPGGKCFGVRNWTGASNYCQISTDFYFPRMQFIQDAGEVRRHPVKDLIKKPQ